MASLQGIEYIIPIYEIFNKQVAVNWLYNNKHIHINYKAIYYILQIIK